MSDRNAGDGEILDRPQCVNAPVDRSRDVGLAKEIVLAPRRLGAKLEGSGRDELKRRRLGRFYDGLIEISLGHGANPFMSSRGANGPRL